MTVPTVAPNELIESSWGNSVANEINTLLVRKAGDTMTGQLTLPAANPTSVNHATRKGYVDAAIANSASDLTTDINAVDDKADARVKKAGDTMSGTLYAPYVRCGAAPTAGNGIQIEETGRAVLRCGTDGSPSIWINRVAAGDAIGQMYIRFLRTDSETSIGSITYAGGNAVAYNTTSDHRLKERLGPITDAATRISELAGKAFRGRWRADGERAWDMLNAHDVAAVAPYAVTGDLDAVDTDGRIVPQEVHYGALVPLLVAALGNALDRIAALEART